MLKRSINPMLAKNAMPIVPKNEERAENHVVLRHWIAQPGPGVDPVSIAKNVPAWHIADVD